MYYQRYQDNAADTCPKPGVVQYKNPADHSAGNVAIGSGSPGYDPYGGCKDDPNSYFPLTGLSGWSKDRATAASVTVDGTAWGFQVTGSAGFTSDILQDYEVPAGDVTTYICGNGTLPNISKVYDTLH